jgi:hypothetical protein
MELLYSIGVAVPFVLLGGAILRDFRGLRDFFAGVDGKGKKGRLQMIRLVGWFFIIVPLYPVFYEMIRVF